MAMPDAERFLRNLEQGNVRAALDRTPCTVSIHPAPGGWHVSIGDLEGHWESVGAINVSVADAMTHCAHHIRNQHEYRNLVNERAAWASGAEWVAKTLCDAHMITGVLPVVRLPEDPQPVGEIFQWRGRSMREWAKELWKGEVR